MQLRIHNNALIEAIVIDDDSILKSLKWLTGFDKQQLIELLRDSIRSSINRHYSNRQRLAEIDVKEIDLEEFRRLDQLEVDAIDQLRKQYNSLDSLVPPIQRTVQQFLRDYQN